MGDTSFNSAEVLGEYKGAGRERGTHYGFHVLFLQYLLPRLVKTYCTHKHDLAVDLINSGFYDFCVSGGQLD